MIDERLDGDFEVGLRVRPSYRTIIVPLDGGGEVRISKWQYPKHVFEFNLAPGDARSDEDFQFLRDMYYAAGGAFEAFRFKHLDDFEGVGEALGAIVGTTSSFQLMRNYTRGLITRQRKITRPVLGTVTLYLNDVEIPEINYTVDYDTGIVAFGSPQDIALLTADFEYDVPVRFEDDEIEMLSIAKELTQPVSISLIEIKE
jgi:uncharacterized protein (TIGR02217 family)